MIANSCRKLLVYARPAVLLVGLTLTACVAPTSPPQQVQSTNPTVTYTYRGDQELLQANQNAAAFCGRYQSVPRTASVTNAANGAKVASYECVTPSPTPVAAMPATAVPVASMPSSNPNLTYTYRTDQDFLNASRSAQTYCVNNGSQQAVSSVAINADGTRTASFQCR